MISYDAVVMQGKEKKCSISVTRAEFLFGLLRCCFCCFSLCELSFLDEIIKVLVAMTDTKTIMIL